MDGVSELPYQPLPFITSLKYQSYVRRITSCFDEAYPNQKGLAQSRLCSISFQLRKFAKEQTATPQHTQVLLHHLIAARPTFNMDFLHLLSEGSWISNKVLPMVLSMLDAMTFTPLQQLALQATTLKILKNYRLDRFAEFKQSLINKFDLPEQALQGYLLEAIFNNQVETIRRYLKRFPDAAAHSLHHPRLQQTKLPAAWAKQAGHNRLIALFNADAPSTTPSLLLLERLRRQLSMDMAEDKLKVLAAPKIPPSSALIKAIANDEYALAKQLIQANKQDIINQPGASGAYPIHLVTDLSAYSGLSKREIKALNELALLLIKHGAQLDIPCEGMLPIHYAAYNGSLDVLIALTQNGKPEAVNQTDAAGRTPLHYAIERQHDAVADYLIQCRNIQFKAVQLEPNAPKITFAAFIERFHPDYLAKLYDINAQEEASLVENQSLPKLRFGK